MKDGACGLLIWMVLICWGSVAAQSVQVSNAGARVDVNGDTIDVHDGRVTRFGDRYYWYGTAYGSTTGFTRSNEYRVYSSPDLETWTPHGAILPTAPSGIYYRPHVIFDAQRQRYVLWYNWYPKLWEGYFGVAVSDSPTGPFEVVSTDVKVKHSALGVGDFNLFVDDDATAYLMYNTIEGHRLSVEKLADDFLHSSQENGGFVADHCEAGSIFKRGDQYYLLTDYTCCFCTQGSGARVYTSDQALGPFTFRQNINRQPGRTAPRLTDGDLRPTQYTRLQRTDSTAFAQIQIAFGGDQALQGLELIQYTGNRSGMCGDTTATRTHDPRETATLGVEARINGDWQVLVPSGITQRRSSLVSTTELSWPNVEADALRLTVDSTYSYAALQLIELRPQTSSGRLLSAADGAYAYLLDQNPMHTPPIVPAQQTFVMPIVLDGQEEFLWMGDLWGSAPDNVKGHDQQYWSSPLKFYANGLIRPLRWEDEWTAP